MRGLLLAWLCAGAMIVAGCTAPQRDGGETPVQPPSIPPPATPGPPGPSTPPGPPSPNGTPPAPGPTPPPPEPRLQVVPDRAAFRAGERITITATFTNTATTPFRYTSRDGCNDIGVWVEDTREAQVIGGERVPQTAHTMLWPEDGPYGCPAVLQGFTIEPGGRVTARVVWDGSLNGTGGAPYAAPGTYVVRADFDGWSHPANASWPTEGAANLTLEPDWDDRVELVTYLRGRSHAGATTASVFPDHPRPGPAPARCVASIGAVEEGTCQVRANASSMGPWGDPEDRTVPWTVEGTWPRDAPDRMLRAYDAEGTEVARWIGRAASWAGWAIE